MKIITGYSGEYAGMFDVIDKTDFSGIKFVSKFIKPDDVILDVACGTGKDLQWLSENLPFSKSLELYGVDVAPDMLKQAGSRDCIDGVIAADVSSKEFLRRSEMHKFDLAYCLTSFGLIDDTMNAVKNISTKLRSGGKFIFGYWNAEVLNHKDPTDNEEILKGVKRRIIRFISGKYCITTYVYNPGSNDAFIVTHYVRLYSLSEIRDIMDNANMSFEVSNGYSLDPYNQYSLYPTIIGTKL